MMDLLCGVLRAHDYAYFRTVITKSQDCVTGANVTIMSHYKIYDRKNGSNPTDIFKIKLLKLHVY